MARRAQGRRDGDVPDVRPPQLPASNPPAVLSMAELLETAQDISRMTIAHEIVLNCDFKEQEVNLPPISLENRVKETLHKAFWDRLKQQLSASPPDYTLVIQLLQEIKDSILLLLLPQQSHLQSQIEAALDMELIRQEAEHVALDVSSLAVYILSTMKMLCAPIRDEEVQKLQCVTEPVQLLREIFRVLDLMKMDMANFTIQSLRPHLQDHAIHYEQKKFQARLAKLPYRLYHTTEWLRKAAEVSVSSSSHLETLLMDQARLQEIQLQVNQLTVIAAVLLLSSNVCGNILFSSPAFVERLKRVTKALLEGLPYTRFQEALLDISNHVHREVSEALLQLGYPAFSSEKFASLKGQIRSIAEKDNAVRSVIEQRIHTFLSLHLSSTTQNSHNLPKGLAPVQEELLELGQRFSSVIHHNRQVYEPYYLAILKEVLPRAEPDAGIGSF